MGMSVYNCCFDIGLWTKNMKVRLFIVFTFGIILGCIATNLYIGICERTPTIACIGKVQLGTASYQDNRLSNAIFIDNPEGLIKTT
jgi:hypothetical protein